MPTSALICAGCAGTCAGWNRAETRTSAPCAACAPVVYVCARTCAPQNTHPTPNTMHRSFTRVDASRTYRTCRTHAPFTPISSRTSNRTTRTEVKEVVAMSQKPRVTTCGIENQAEFRQRLRAQPDIHAFAAALYQAGMLDGLAGARLAEGGTLPSDGVQPVLNLEAEQRLAKRKGAR